jgi:ferric enterobactin receptor
MITIRQAQHTLVAVLLVAGPYTLFAQASRTPPRTVTLSGTVRDSVSGEVLPNVRVSLAGLQRSAMTNADGRFVLVSVPVGTHVIRTQYIGYATREMRVVAEPGAKPVVLLLARAVVQLATTQVTGDDESRSTVSTVGADVGQLSISTAQVEKMPSIGEPDVFRTLQMLPSVAGTGGGTASLSVRGGRADQNLVLLDGMTVYHVDHFFGLFSAFNTDALKDIQLYAGGFGARYGGRVSSVIDLTGKAGDEQNFRASGGASLLSARGVVEVPLGRGSILISARRSYTDLIQSGLYSRLFDVARSQSTSTGNQQGPFQRQSVQPSFFFYDFNTKLTYRPTSKDVTTLSVYLSRDNLDQSQDGSRGGGGGFGGGIAVPTVTDITDWGNRGVSGRWFRQWFGRLSSDALVALSNYDSNSDRTASGGLSTGGNRFSFGFSEVNTVRDLTSRIDNSLDVARWSRVTFGAAQTRNDVTYRYSVSGNDTTQAGRNTVRDGSATTSSGYLQHTFTPFSALDLTTGYRATRYSATQQTYFEPRINAGLNITSSFRLKGAWGRYHQFVNRVENEDVLQGSRDFWLLADTALRPNGSTHVIVGALFDRPSWSLNVEAYDKTLENATLFSRRYRQAFGANAGAFFFTGTGRSRGIELLAQRKRGLFTGWASYTLAKSTNTFAEVDDGREFPTAQDQRHELKGFGSYQMGPWEFSATALFGSGRPYTAPLSQYQIKLLDGTTQTYVNVSDKNGERLASFQRVDLGVSRIIETTGAFDWRVGLSLYNIANRRNINFRRFDLSTQPIAISDVTQLGFTPSLDVKIILRDPRNRAARSSR